MLNIFSENRRTSHSCGGHSVHLCLIGLGFTSQTAAGTVYVATDEHANFQGFVVSYSKEGYCLLGTIAVLPSSTGRAIENVLIECCEDAALQCGMSVVHLYKNERMIDNLLIYKKLYFLKVAERSGEGFGRVYFEKKLTQPCVPSYTDGDHQCMNLARHLQLDS